jgi:enoyl-CoA hydratase
MNDDADPVLLDVANGIATITLNRPAQRNALSVAAANRLHALWELVEHDDAVQVVILTAAECGTFCAGLDLLEAARIKAEEGLDILSLMKDPFHGRMRQLSKPIIAALTGHVMAGGMLLALNADLRVGLAGTQVAITEVKTGRGSPWAVPLLWMLPQPLLMEMVLTGEPFPVERFVELGFINHLAATTDAVRAKALQLAQSIRDNAPLSVRAGKKSILDAMSVGCDAGLALAQRTYVPVYASADAQEGPLAFAEKRPPRWSGR